MRGCVLQFHFSKILPNGAHTLRSTANGTSLSLLRATENIVSAVFTSGGRSSAQARAAVESMPGGFQLLQGFLTDKRNVTITPEAVSPFDYVTQSLHLSLQVFNHKRRSIFFQERMNFN